MNFRIKLISLATVIPLLITGCSLGSGSVAKEICDARFKLVDTDPNTDSGAEYWVSIWQKSSELKNSPDSAATADELAVAVTMDGWFNSTLNAVGNDMTWPQLGSEWADYGLEMNKVCAPFE